MKLTDEARSEFEKKLSTSVVDKRLLPYILSLERSNYDAFDRLAMLMLSFGDTAFIYGVQLAIYLDGNPSDIGLIED